MFVQAYMLFLVVFFSASLCSRNFQNVKLRLDFVEIWSFYRHPDFTWNGEFKQFKNVNFDNFRGSEFWFLVNLSNVQVPNLPKIQSSESLKLAKMTFLNRLNSSIFDFTENLSGSKMISQAITSHFESFLSIVQVITSSV